MIRALDARAFNCLVGITALASRYGPEMLRQARAPRTQPFGAEAFEARDVTVLRWLGMAGFLNNSRGTTLMLDPLLGGFDMPVMIEFPIAAADGEVGCCPGQAQRQRPLQRPDLS